MKSTSGTIGFDCERDRAMKNHGLAAGLGLLAAVLFFWPVTSDAVTHQLQVASVPVIAVSSLAQTLESGTFAAWTERHAASYDGLSVMVGRPPGLQQSDTLYLVVRMPQTEQAYKVILGWENSDASGRGTGGSA